MQQKITTKLPFFKTIFLRLSLLIFTIVLFENSLLGNPYVDVRFNPITDCNETDLYCANVQIQGADGANYIGISTLRLGYDDEVLLFFGNGLTEENIGSFTPINFDGNQDDLNAECADGFGFDPYSNTAYDGLAGGDILTTIVLTSPTPSTGSPIFACPSIEEEWVDVFEICFEVLDPLGDPNLHIQGIQNGSPEGDESGTNFNSHFNDPTNKYLNGTFESLHLSFYEMCALSGVVYGCIDSTAVNYNPLANVDDGSCTYCESENSIFACTEPIQTIEICIENENVCTLTDNHTLTEVVSLFDCSITLLNDSCFSYIPLPGLETVGEDVIEITVCDTLNSTLCETLIAVIEIGDCGNNNPPNAQSDFGNTSENISVTINLFFNDYDIEDGDDLSFALTENDGQASNGTVVFNDDGTIVYTPNAGFVGLDSFTYTVSDSEGDTDQAFVTIAVDAFEDCDPDFSICREPFSATNLEPSYLCVEFCEDGLEISEDGLRPLFFDCSLEIDELDPTCFTYLPLPGFIGDELIEVIACNPTNSICDTAYIGVTTTADIDNCIEVGNVPPAPPTIEELLIRYNPFTSTTKGEANAQKTENDGLLDNNEKSISQTFDVYPNPSNGRVFVKVPIHKTAEQHMVLYDITGKPILEKTIPINSNNAIVEFDLKDFLSGCYLIKIQSPEQFFAQRLILK